MSDAHKTKKELSSKKDESIAVMHQTQIVDNAAAQEQPGFNLEPLVVCLEKVGGRYDQNRL